MALNVESSLTDLMTSLAVVFIMLMLALAQNQASELQHGGRARLEKLQGYLNHELQWVDLNCENLPEDPLACVIRLPDSRLRFLVNRADLDPKGKAFLQQVVPRVVTVLNKKDVKPDVESVYIQGFTDSDGNDETNLFLSQQRAFSVGYYVVSSVLKTSPYRNQLLRWLYVNGRGEQERLFYDPSTRQHENKAASRRVEVRIRVKPYELRLQQNTNLNINSAAQAIRHEISKEGK
jgi:outer membrane protein OmpA-like peptidoglycan-associated protein